MAGSGQRFRNAGFNIPKMMIYAAGRPMLYWALDSLKPWILEGQEQQQVIFICLKEHLDEYPLEQTILQYCKRAKIIVLNNRTQGQAQTVLTAKNHFQENDPLLIY